MTQEEIASTLSEYRLSDPRLLALCIWREARGECLQAQIAVGKTVLNRCAMAPAQGFQHDIVGNILKPFAFSSFNPGDVNASKFPTETDPSWKRCQAAADEALTSNYDLTRGSVFYFSAPLTAPPHAWGTVEFKAVIGNLKFYRPPG